MHLHIALTFIAMLWLPSSNPAQQRLPRVEVVLEIKFIHLYHINVGETSYNSPQSHIPTSPLSSRIAGVIKRPFETIWNGTETMLSSSSQ